MFVTVLLTRQYHEYLPKSNYLKLQVTPDEQPAGHPQFLVLEICSVAGNLYGNFSCMWDINGV
jgi:hypothetical protein